MQVHKPSQSLILAHSMLPFVSDLKHKVIELDGKKHVAVKHDDQSTQVLRDSGLDVPSPIMCYYKFPKLKGQYDPMQHQYKAVEFMVDPKNKRCFNLSEPRTGKTYSILMAFDYLRQTKQVNKMIIYSTLSTLNSVWAQSIFDTFPHYTYMVVYGDRKKRLECLAQDVDIYIVNHDGVKVLEEDLIKRKDIDMVAWDEADVLSNAQSQMWKSFKNTLHPRQRVILATGTPTGDRPTSAWALTKLVSPDNVPKYFGAFKQMVMTQFSQFVWKPKRNANEIVHKVMQPAICFRKADVIDLPPLVHERRECELSTEQKKHYESMRKDMVLHHKEDEHITAVTAADKVLKLMQIALGAFKIGDGEYQELDCKSRVETILECIRHTPQKTIVFVPFTGALHLYHKEISKEFTCEIVYGETSKNERDRIFKSFQDDENPRVLIAHPKTTAHGLELSAADTIIWAAPATSGVQFLQANERIASALQKHDMTVFYIGATPIEWKRYDSLIDKKNDQAALLDMYKELISS